MRRPRSKSCVGQTLPRGTPGLSSLDATQRPQHHKSICTRYWKPKTLLGLGWGHECTERVPRHPWRDPIANGWCALEDRSACQARPLGLSCRRAVCKRRSTDEPRKCRSTDGPRKCRSTDGPRKCRLTNQKDICRLQAHCDRKSWNAGRNSSTSAMPSDRCSKDLSICYTNHRIDRLTEEVSIDRNPT